MTSEAQEGRRVGGWLPLVWLGASAVLLAACGGDGDADLRLAEARVATKEKALSSAQAEAETATAAFCDASRAYIVALDRYGDVLNATAPTVGDVRDAGADLAEPREDAVAGAEAAVSAQEQLATAEQELAEAQAALAAAQAGPDQEGPTQPSTTQATPAPLAPEATVDRVQQADADFTAAQAGITDQTPLAQASQQFNAAAVALEMSWLQLFADAGCLTNEQQKQAEAAVREYTRSLQEALAAAGYYKDEVDGVYGPATVDAVEGLQEAHGLPVTGTVDRATAAALQAELGAKGGAAARKAVTSTAAVQQTLKLAGFWDGPVDGEWTPELTEALQEFQAELGVEQTGTVDAATVAALEEALAAREDTEPTAASSAAPPASSTAPGSTTAPSTPTPTGS
jgi:peptidoglycan hydrolase-like protein with peptidoglycan-binding domain